jgi:type IV pilus assembly protein PilC
MATKKQIASKEFIFEWQGQNRAGKAVSGEIKAGKTNQVEVALKRQGIKPLKIKKRHLRTIHSIKTKELASFTRQLATLLKAGVPLLQSFDAIGRGNANPDLTHLLNVIRVDIETGTSLSTAFGKHPIHFSKLYCNLIEAGESAGILDLVLDRLATYMEKTEALKSKIKSALMYPIAVLIVAFVVTAMILIFVVPTFKDVFANFGADLPAATLVVIAISNIFVNYWWVIFGILLGGGYFFMHMWNSNEKLQKAMDQFMLKMPFFGSLINKSCTARWTRTLSTMFAAGVPLIEALNTVAGSAGNSVYSRATYTIQQEISNGAALTTAMSNTQLFPPMVLQMCAIGEESGSIDHMLGKAADYYDAEIDDMVAGISSLIEPIIIVVLGVVIGAIVVAMYLPIFKLGQVV